MERPYTVALHGGEALPAPRRIAAEVGFIAAIERSLGDPAQVAASYRAAMANNPALDAAAAALAQRWSEAYRVARHDAIRAGSLAADAHFELRLTRGAGPA